MEHGNNPELAVIDPNMLVCLGLKGILQEILPQATVRLFAEFGSFIDDTPDMYRYYFISSQTYILYHAFFLPRREKTVILLNGAGSHAFHSSHYLLNIFQSPQSLKKDLEKLFRKEKGKSVPQAVGDDLSAREIDVLRLVTQGYINKEIADKLGISLTTVISHRKNITEKLGIKSVSGLTIYAVMNGYIDADRI